MSPDSTWRLATRAVHAGRPEQRPDFIPSITPVHPSVTYRYPSMEDLDAVFDGRRDGYVYARHGSPTVNAFEEAAAALENGQAALALSSGMAAIH
ncbi:MAG: PLP-dependent transferase, partial [Anaerolineae bacterium]